MSFAALFLSALVSAPTSHAAPGDLDATFDADGIAVTAAAPGNGLDSARAVAVQPDGRIVVAGYATTGSRELAVVRYSSNGVLDTTFSGDGIATFDIGTGDDGASDVAIAPDGKIVVSGTAVTGGDSDFAVVRITVAGELDTTFSTDGKATFSIDTNDALNAVQVMPDGRIVAVGQTGVANPDMVAARIMPSGDLDAAFDDGVAPAGVVRVSASTASDAAQDVAVYGNSSLIVAGSAAGDTALVKLTAAGAPDTSFASDGSAVFALNPAADAAEAVDLMSDGRIVVGGFVSNGTNADFMAARFTSSGALDTSFSSDGVAVAPIGPGDDFGRDMWLQGDGRPVIAGSASNGTSSDFGVVRFGLDGTLDATFSGDGIATVNLSPTSEADDAYDVAPQATGRIVVAGTVVQGANADFGVMRMQNDAVDLALSMVDRPDPAVVGRRVTYTMKVTNRGAETSRRTMLTDTLVSSLRHVSTTTTAGSCSGTVAIRCELGALAPAATATVKIVVSPRQPGSVRNRAFVTNLVGDLNAADNTRVKATRVRRQTRVSMYQTTRSARIKKCGPPRRQCRYLIAMSVYVKGKVVPLGETTRKNVAVTLYRKSGNRWKRKFAVLVPLQQSGAYRGRVPGIRLSAGRWRARATVAGTLTTTPGASGYSYFTVRALARR